MTDVQLSKFSCHEKMFRIRWYTHRSGVALVLEQFGDGEWNEIEKRDDGRGSPNVTAETEWEKKMKRVALDDYCSSYERQCYEKLDGRHVRSQS